MFLPVAPGFPSMLTSARSQFNVASHVKTVLILAAGWLLEPGGFGWIEFLGTAMAAGGAVVYSFSGQ